MTARGLNDMRFSELSHRGVLKITGDPAHGFLQNLITTDMDAVDAAGAGFGALLTPQGKIQFDFLIARTADGSYLLDTPTQIIEDLQKRLGFYRLRTKIEIERTALAVFAVWDGDLPDLAEAIAFPDPRLPELGHRVIGVAMDVRQALETAGTEDAGPGGYAAHRLALGVPEAPADFAYADIFPHDADMDQLNGVSFSKGCYVGQEIVSRMQHRGTARKRMVQITSPHALPAPGTAILAGDIKVGALGSSAMMDSKARGIGLVRLDKVRAALEKGVPLTCDGAPLAVDLPEWAKFTWPGTDPAS